MSIEIKNVTKYFEGVTALKNVSLTFEYGVIYGLLGRNGAGKSTLLNIVTDRVLPYEGSVTVDGALSHDNDKALGKMYLMSDKNINPNMKVRKAFKWTKDFYGSFRTERALELCNMFGLDLEKKVSELSTGYTAVYKIIKAFCLDVPYVFLDEPVLGLDANHRELFYKLLIEEYSENPRTYVIATHLIDEIADIIQNVVIIKEGKVLRDTTAENLLSEGYSVTGKTADVEKFIENKKLLGKDTLGSLMTAYVSGTPENIPENLEISRLDLQKMFIQLTS